MTEIKPRRMNAGMQELLDDIDIEREINKIKADAVREFGKTLRSNTMKLKCEMFAKKLEQGE